MSEEIEKDIIADYFKMRWVLGVILQEIDRTNELLHMRPAIIKHKQYFESKLEEVYNGR